MSIRITEILSKRIANRIRFKESSLLPKGDGIYDDTRLLKYWVEYRGVIPHKSIYGGRFFNVPSSIKIIGRKDDQPLQITHNRAKEIT